MVERKQGRRSAQTAEETKMHILCVAGNMFCTNGYEKVSLRNISEAAGVSHSLIRHHFGSKEQIWYAISDALHQHMKDYIAKLIEEIPDDKPANVALYTFAIRLLAHSLLTPQPIQFVADAVRQEGEFFDYFIDQHGTFEQVLVSLSDKHNEENPEQPISMYEIKWQLILHAHAAHSLKPLLNSVWKDQSLSPEEALFKHWQLFNRQLATLLKVSQDEMINPENLEELLLSIPCQFEGYQCDSNEIN